MDTATAPSVVGRILGTDVAGMFTPEDYEAFLARSLTYDAEGRLPGADGYIATHDEYWLAAEAAELLAVRQAADGQLTRFTSEGATFEVTGADWATVAARLRGLSPLARIRAAMAPTSTTLPVDAGTGYDPRSQGWPHRVRGGVIGNWS